MLIPERAAAVRRIFQLAAGGYGIQATIKKLIEEGHKPFGEREVVVDQDGKTVETTARGKSTPKFKAGPDGRYGAGVWNRPYISKILRDRRAVGEHQPCGKGRKPDGEPIKNYFPAVVSEEEWNASRGVRNNGNAFPGRGRASASTSSRGCSAMPRTATHSFLARPAAN